MSKRKSKADQAAQKKDAPAKSLEEYKQETEQLTLFEYLLAGDRPYSNTIELYDFIPKYVWGKSERIHGQFLKTLKREFECKGIRYKVEIEPARIQDKSGAEKEYYPGQREELVEDALRKFVCEGQGRFLDDQAGVVFSLYQLQEELKSKGHSYSKDQIKDALLICAKAKITINSEDGNLSLISSLFETLGLSTRDDWKDKKHKARAFVRFHPLITRSINSGTFRQLNYEKTMTYKSVIARQFHKRISHVYTQASITNTFGIMLSTVIRDFGLTAYAQLRDNLRDVTLALEEMKSKEVLMFYTIEKVTDTKNRNKLIDAKLILTPHPNFVREAVKANQRPKNKTKTLSSSRT